MPRHGQILWKSGSDSLQYTVIFEASDHPNKMPSVCLREEQDSDVAILYIGTGIERGGQEDSQGSARKQGKIAMQMTLDLVLFGISRS